MRIWISFWLQTTGMLASIPARMPYRPRISSPTLTTFAEPLDPLGDEVRVVRQTGDPARDVGLVAAALVVDDDLAGRVAAGDQVPAGGPERPHRRDLFGRQLHREAEMALRHHPGWVM